MVRGGDDLWTYTCKPLDPGFHYYFQFADSREPLYFGWQRPTNGVEIPDPKLDIYLPRAVPRGEVRIRPYYSELTKAWREAYVYTPPSPTMALRQYRFLPGDSPWPPLPH